MDQYTNSPSFFPSPPQVRARITVDKWRRPFPCSSPLPCLVLLPLRFFFFLSQTAPEHSAKPPPPTASSHRPGTLTGATFPRLNSTSLTLLLSKARARQKFRSKKKCHWMKIVICRMIWSARFSSRGKRVRHSHRLVVFDRLSVLVSILFRGYLFPFSID